MRKLIVNKKYDNKKLNNFILDSFPNLSTNTLYKALRQKDIKINGQRIKENINIHENDEILIYISDDFLFPNIQLDIVYEDNNIIVVNKPKNIEIVGDYSVTSLLNKKYNTTNIKPCHRLDRNTTGLTVFAKNDESLNILLDMFKNNEIEKHYKAKVYGIPPKKHDILHAFLFKDAKKSLVYISDSPKKRI